MKDNVVFKLRKLTGDKTIREDSYPGLYDRIFVSDKDEDLEWTIDNQGNIIEHTGWSKKIVGNILRRK